MEYHRLLKRQIKKYFGDKTNDVSLSWSFLDAVNEAYITFENDYKQLDRTLEISSEELFKTNQNLSKVNEELDRFVYSASHDLKAPLSSLLGLIELAKLDIEDPQAMLEYLQMMQRSVIRLMKIIDDLADFSRNERTTVQRNHINFHTVIAEILEDLQFIPHFQQITFLLDIRMETEQPFQTDLLRLRMLLNNLLANALLHHNLRQPTPIVIVEINYDYKKANICISDNGKGIDQHHHHKIFDMFYRASEDAKGSGLGLYIVKGVIEKLQGTIGFDSEPECGTIFNIEIPNMAYRNQ